MNSKMGQGKINICCILRDVARNLWMTVLVGISASLLAYVVANVTYHPTYTSDTTLVVSAKGSVSGPYGNLTAVNKLTDMFEAVMDSQVLKKMVITELGVDSFNGNVNIAVVPETNLLTVAVTSSVPEDAFRLLKTMLECYPTVGKEVLGDVVLEVFEEPAFPTRPNSVVDERDVCKKAFVVGAVFMFAVLSFLSYLKNTVKDVQDIEAKLDTKEFATIYHETKYRNFKEFLLRKKKRFFITDPSLSFNYTETIKKIRTRLLFQIKKKNLKVIYVTSVSAGEGKSTVAMNLAESLAQRYEKVLLIEGNLKSPSLAAMMSLEEGTYKDWSQYLTGKKQIAEAICKLDGYKFQALLNSSELNNSAEWLLTEKMRKFIQDMRKEMDVIVVDGPATRRSSDAEIWARLSDASLLVVKQNVVPVKYINDTIDMLNGYGSGLLGCIFNDVMTLGGNISYGYGYGYSYRYGYGGYGKYGRYGKYGKYGKYDKNK